MTSRSVVPIGTSTTPGDTTSPTTVQITVPGDLSLPTERKASTPLARIHAACARVSALFTSVGLGSGPSSSDSAAGSGDGAACQPSWGPVAKSPCRYGGSQRGSGSLPSITSSSAFSSPKRYSSGPVTTVTVIPPSQSASSTSTSALRTASSSGAKLAFIAMNASVAPTDSAAMSSPSITAYGFARSSALSLKVPGSPSAALHTA